MSGKRPQIKHTENLEAIVELSTAITASLDLSQTCRTACRIAMEQLGVDHSGFVLFSDDLESTDM